MNASVRHRPTLIELTSAPEHRLLWAQYNEIRRVELFDPLGLSILYRPHGPQKDDSSKLGFVLADENGETIGMARLQLLDGGPVAAAVIRSFAVTRARQGSGHGRTLLTKLHHVARRENRRLLLVNAADGAVGFYRKLGYLPCPWKDAGEQWPAPIVQMARLLADET